MKRVAIAGASGMLGSMVYKVLKDTYSLILIYRDKEKFRKLEKSYGNTSTHQAILFDFLDIYYDYLFGFTRNKISPKLEALTQKIGAVDALINCAGIINRYADKNPSQTFFINSALPHLLSSIYKEKLIHVSSDCVFNGISDAPYNENSPHTPTDIYGLSKSLGEPSMHSLVLRTSVIGPEIENFVSLLEWLKRQKGKTINGYTNHYWNGITTRQFAIICQKIIDNPRKFPKTGLFHLFSDTQTKYEMLKKLREKYQIDVKIKPVKALPIDRRLASIYNFCRDLSIPSFNEMLAELN